MMRSLDLFSGYGGITIALKDYAEPIGYCEIEPYARAILASRIETGDLPAAPIFPDVRNLRGSLGDADIIVGGFPCQDISVAGNGKGLEGERSGLFFEVVRLAKEIQPAFVFLENVPAIRTRGLEVVLREFTALGYDCRWTMLSASQLGAPHKRERWFLLAAHTDRINVRDFKQWPARGRNDIQTQGEGEPFCNGKKGTFANSMCEGLERQRKEPGIAVSKISGFGGEHRWKTESPVCGMVDGTPHWVDRIKSIGNGVVPIQVQTAFETLMGIEVSA